MCVCVCHRYKITPFPGLWPFFYFLCVKKISTSPPETPWNFKAFVQGTFFFFFAHLGIFFGSPPSILHFSGFSKNKKKNGSTFFGVSFCDSIVILISPAFSDFLSLFLCRFLRPGGCQLLTCLEIAENVACHVVTSLTFPSMPSPLPQWRRTKTRIGGRQDEWMTDWLIRGVACIVSVLGRWWAWGVACKEVV